MEFLSGQVSCRVGLWEGCEVGTKTGGERAHLGFEKDVGDPAPGQALTCS